MELLRALKNIQGYLLGDYQYEYCPRCRANLKLQKGYDNTLPYWDCRGCGMTLINPAVDAEDDIAWICDGCGEMLNIQPGFDTNCGQWTCKSCGFVNKIDESELYASEDEFRAAMRSPYRGLSDEDVLSLAMYQDEKPLQGEEDSIRHLPLLVYRPDTGKRYVKKLLGIYEKSIYTYLRDHPAAHMPKITEIYESDNCLIVIEEYIEGRTLSEAMEQAPLSEERAVSIAIELCSILEELHNLPTPIVHRDVKPSNVMITKTGEVILLDVNAARWENAKKTDDTRFIGTEDYAAPEQYGFGEASSTGKADIYAMGVLLNVMLTGRPPKYKHVTGRLQPVIDRCTRLDARERYTAKELKEVLHMPSSPSAAAQHLFPDGKCVSRS